MTKTERYAIKMLVHAKQKRIRTSDVCRERNYIWKTPKDENVKQARLLAEKL